MSININTIDELKYSVLKIVRVGKMSDFQMS